MGVAKSDSLRCVVIRPDLTENVERFARIDLDLSDFEKERNSGQVNRHSYIHSSAVKQYLQTGGHTCC